MHFHICQKHSHQLHCNVQLQRTFDSWWLKRKKKKYTLNLHLYCNFIFPRRVHNIIALAGKKVRICFIHSLNESAKVKFNSLEFINSNCCIKIQISTNYNWNFAFILSICAENFVFCMHFIHSVWFVFHSLNSEHVNLAVCVIELSLHTAINHNGDVEHSTRVRICILDSKE